MGEKYLHIRITELLEEKKISKTRICKTSHFGILEEMKLPY